MVDARTSTNTSTFYVLTATQVLSLIGSMMTGIAVSIRVFADTGDSTPLLLSSFFGALPLMVGGSLAGVLVDRWNRRRVLIVTDLAQAFLTLLLLSSFAMDRFQLWHLYTVSLLHGLLGMLQRPAMEASVTMLVPEAHRDRANAIRQMAGPAAGIITPVIAGTLYPLLGVPGVMVVDLVTCALAVAVVTMVHIPQPCRTVVGGVGQGSLWAEMRSGLAFLWQRPVLLALMLWAATINLLLSGPMRLNTPYILTLTGSETALGVLLGIMNTGMVLGGVVVGICGGTRPRIHGVMIGLLFRAFWVAAYGLARTKVALGVSLFFVFSANALIDASFMSLIQIKVPPDMQGRVFALLFQMMYIANPLSLLLTGPLVDRVLEPAVGTPGWQLVAPLVGGQPGSGMGLLMLISGGLMFTSTLLIYAWPKTRSLEADIPDYAAREPLV